MDCLVMSPYKCYFGYRKAKALRDSHQTAKQHMYYMIFFHT